VLSRIWPTKRNTFNRTLTSHHICLSPVIAVPRQYQCRNNSCFLSTKLTKRSTTSLLRTFASVLTEKRRLLARSQCTRGESNLSLRGIKQA
jgi:hypothetical protein